MILMNILGRSTPGRRGTALLVLIAAFALVACNGDDGDDSPTEAPTATEAPTEAPATAEPTEAPATEPPATETPTPEPMAGLEVAVAEDGELGSYLVGPEGLTLYTFTRDEPNVTNCSGDCLEAWPPLLLEEGQEVESDAAATGEFGTTESEEGEQVTYMGAPLYYWASDSAPGDTTGHGVGGVWFVARADTASTSVVNVQTAGDLAPHLVGPDGMTLYLFTNDEAGVSNCAGDCAVNWPPLTVPDGMDPTAVEGAPGELGVIERDDDLGRQVTYDGIPLYYWASDTLPGDTTGDGVGDVWFVVPPVSEDPAAATGPTSTAAADDEPYTY